LTERCPVLAVLNPFREAMKEAFFAKFRVSVVGRNQADLDLQGLSQTLNSAAYMLSCLG
jgi:hypothetical protein